MIVGRWFAVGQNLYMSSSTGYDKVPDWDAAVQAWFDEHKYYTYPGGFSPLTGHYTQVNIAEMYCNCL